MVEFLAGGYRKFPTKHQSIYNDWSKMPDFNFDSIYKIRERSEYGKMIDRMYYEERSISAAHYEKLCRKPKCWI